MIELELPYPPTVNHYRIPVRGRLITSPEGRLYLDKARLWLIQQRAKAINGSVSVSIDWHVPDKRKRDPDNILKPILDSLKGFGYEDDSRIDELHVYRREVIKGGKCIVRIESMDAAS